MKPTLPFRVIVVCIGVLLGSAGYAQESKFDEPPMPTKTVPPVYPSALKHDGVSGMVTMSITVDESGNVQNPVVKKSTRQEFEQPAIDAVTKWKFEPAKKDGKAVAVQVVVPVKFSVN
ncbi:MAG: TonB family protein [Opitutaceae bacterium]